MKKTVLIKDYVYDVAQNRYRLIMFYKEDDQTHKITKNLGLYSVSTLTGLTSLVTWVPRQLVALLEENLQFEVLYDSRSKQDLPF